ncbi:uncharacterized protein EV422DRAFT_372206 [Fimicolochytrium jonesii]|uniref:uncharacterized protein n=1 Tax=Fimicolochytrium jonesii TaxID=1396493 RepID=UPI0022FEBEF9|nr:uncharacterized protein EV422DRAFT_372206 [Fimicolochytrium jonesii]KAI8815540.1 hypothetical protein EV422DRAFT_372206 [Fimicolochytrium jonesii]
MIKPFSLFVTYGLKVATVEARQLQIAVQLYATMKETLVDIISIKTEKGNILQLPEDHRIRSCVEEMMTVAKKFIIGVEEKFGETSDYKGTHTKRLIKQFSEVFNSEHEPWLQEQLDEFTRMRKAFSAKVKVATYLKVSEVHTAVHGIDAKASIIQDDIAALAKDFKDVVEARAVVEHISAMMAKPIPGIDHQKALIDKCTKRMEKYPDPLELRDNQGRRIIYWAAHHKLPEVFRWALEASVPLLQKDGFDLFPEDIPESSFLRFTLEPELQVTFATILNRPENRPLLDAWLSDRSS